MPDRSCSQNPFVRYEPSNRTNELVVAGAYRRTTGSRTNARSSVLKCSAVHKYK